MKKHASILKVIYTIAMVIVIIGIVACVLGLVAVLVAGDFSDVAARTHGFITLEGGDPSPAELNALKPVILVALVYGVVILVLTLLGIKKIINVLAECKMETPFTEVSCRNLKGAARLELITGIVGIVGSVILGFMGSSLTFNGTPVSDSTFTLNLTFLIYACALYLLYHVAEHGRKLEEKAL